MRIIRRVDLRNQRLEAWLKDHEVQMRRPEIMATGGPHQLADRAVHRNGIPRRLHTAEMKPPGIIGNEPPAQIHLGLGGTLILIQPLRRRMPDIDFSLRDRSPVAIPEKTVNDKLRPRRW